MRKISISMIVISCVLFTGCGRSNHINGNSTRTAYRSVKHLKNYLPVNQRIEFETSFWTMRDVYRDDAEFLDQVDGKTPQEIITVGKQIFQERKAAGIKGYAEYSSWEAMIAKFAKERMDQGKVKKQPKDPRNDHSVIYKL